MQTPPHLMCPAVGQPAQQGTEALVGSHFPAAGSRCDPLWHAHKTSWAIAPARKLCAAHISSKAAGAPQPSPSPKHCSGAAHCTPRVLSVAQHDEAGSMQTLPHRMWPGVGQATSQGNMAGLLGLETLHPAAATQPCAAGHYTGPHSMQRLAAHRTGLHCCCKLAGTSMPDRSSCCSYSIARKGQCRCCRTGSARRLDSLWHEGSEC